MTDPSPPIPTCPAKGCGLPLGTPALAFLHAQAHAEPWEGPRSTQNLNGLPYALWPRIARLLEDYTASLRAELAEARQSIEALAERCAGQSELLSRRAEGPQS